MDSAVTFEDIVRAREAIRSGLYESPCPESVPLSELTGAHVFCKLDYLQRTGSFKERGARNALITLLSHSPEVARNGVIAASAGNHALGLCYHGGLLGVPVTVVMPVTAPTIKIETCRQLGATVILSGNSFHDAHAVALEMASRLGLRYIPPFDSPSVIAGQGTMALEILEQVDNIDYIIVPVGGGGLIAGTCLVTEAIDPNIKVIGVEPAAAASLLASLRKEHPVTFDVRSTIADGLAVPRVGDIAFGIVRRLVHKMVTVTEDEIALSILKLAELEKSVVEGAAAATLAAILPSKLPELLGKRVVLMLCGGNIDPSMLCRVIERALVADGRLYRCTVLISDRAGGLADFSRIVAATGASIREVVHERAFASVPSSFSTAEVQCILETRNHEHIHEIQELLKLNGIKFLYSRTAGRSKLRKTLMHLG